MTLELIKQNIAREKQIIERIHSLYLIVESGKNNSEKNSAIREINSLLPQLKMINNAIPALAENITFFKKLANTDKPSNISKLEYDSGKEKVLVGVMKKDKGSFLQNALKTDKNTDNERTTKDIEAYSRVSNRLFRNFSNKLVARGYFDALKIDLIKIASPLIINSYVSIMFFSILISLFFSLPIAVMLGFLGFYITAVMVFILVPVFVLVGFLLYPSSTRKSLEKEINQELPFLTIYMAAISTSGIEPSKIFSILVTSKDYPFTQREIKKLNNYINFYGYDLVNALKKVSEVSPSERLSQMFNGLATSISSGGELSTFLNKHADTLLFDYRLEREKYTHVAETFMNIYISIVIAAPMILIMLFILMSLSGFGSTGLLSPSNLTVLIIFAISLINTMFILFLNVKQPRF